MTWWLSMLSQWFSFLIHALAYSSCCFNSTTFLSLHRNSAAEPKNNTSSKQTSTILLSYPACWYKLHDDPLKPEIITACTLIYTNLMLNLRDLTWPVTETSSNLFHNPKSWLTQVSALLHLQFSYLNLSLLTWWTNRPQHTDSTLLRRSPITKICEFPLLLFQPIFEH